MIKLGSHVSMSGKDMLLGSAKEAASYGADTFMVFTGAPQNTKRKDISELNIDSAWEYMDSHNISELIIHAPYIINLGNSVNQKTDELAVEFLRMDLQRSAACQSQTLVLHPGAHVGEGADKGIAQIIKGLNEILTRDTSVHIALETMAGKGSEIGRTFEELARIYDGVVCNDKLRICFDTCNTHDSGYDIVHDFDGVMEHFDKVIGTDQIAVFHINDSRNPRGAGKDRHINIGSGEIGFDALSYIVHHPDFRDIPKILETPYIPSVNHPKKTYPPYKHEIAMLRSGQFNPRLADTVLEEYETDGIR